MPNPPSQKSAVFLPTLKYTGIAIIASTLFITAVLLIIDATGQDGFDVVILGDGTLTLIEALIAGFILSMLPIFLLIVFSFTGIMIFIGLGFALLSVVLALAIPAGIMALPFLLLVGLVYLLRRK